MERKQVRNRCFRHRYARFLPGSMLRRLLFWYIIDRKLRQSKPLDGRKHSSLRFCSAAPGCLENICSRCEDKLIEDHKDLQSYLNKNFRTIHTAIGDVKSLSYEIQVNDPNYWSTCDFEIQIDSILWCDELDSTIDHAVFYGDFLPYEDRIQAVADILDFEMSIIRLAGDAFPDAKFSVSFYDWGYEYPNIKVGFVSTSKLIWRNFKYNNSGQSGYTATSLCKWEAVQGDFLDYLYSDFDKWKQIFADIEEIRPEYNLNF